jgi:hypothetical protein
MKHKAQRRTWRLAAAVLGIVSTAAVAEDVVVKQPAASVMSGKTARSSKVAQLSAGDKVQVLGREGSWLRVKVGDKEGYLHENSVGGSGGGLGAALGEAGKGFSSATGTRGLSSAAAGKGVGDSAAAWAGSKSMNTSGLERMIAMRNSVSEPDWQKFAADGKGGAK